jgi:hypothetical protein
MYLQISLSNPDEASICPSGENLQVKMSPSCPVNIIMGASSPESRGGP